MINAYVGVKKGTIQRLEENCYAEIHFVIAMDTKMSDTIKHDKVNNPDRSKGRHSHKYKFKSKQERLWNY